MGSRGPGASNNLGAAEPPLPPTIYNHLRIQFLLPETS